MANVIAPANNIQRIPAPRVRPSANRGWSVDPIAATRTSASRPIPLSTSTTVVAKVREPATEAVSATLTKSRPILLGRKLLKKLATRKEDVSHRNRKSRCCALSSLPQRHVLVMMIPRYKPDATNKEAGEA